MAKRIIIFLLISVFAAGIITACQPKDEEEPYEEMPVSNDAEEPGYRRTILYFEDDNGYIVPVMKKIKMEEGIGKAALNNLKESTAESLKASGLFAVLPDNAKIDLDISNKLATVDLNKEALQCYNPLAEQNKVIAVVNTLTEFSTVDKVRFLVGGRKVSKLEFGTDVSKPVARFDLNPESADESADLKNASKLTLYFQDRTATHIVPVTRYVSGGADAVTAIAELLKGPVDTMALASAFPEDTKILDASLNEGKFTVDFSKEFGLLAENAKAEAGALKTIFLTCFAFKDVKNVKILVEGKEYEGSAAAMAVPEFPNSFN